MLNCTDAVEKLVPYLADRLQDKETSVKLSAVTSILKITMINPSLFLVTIPTLFEMLKTETSCWLIIKLIKLLTEMTKAEPRLLPKLRAKFMEMLSGKMVLAIVFELIRQVLSSKLSED